MTLALSRIHLSVVVPSADAALSAPPVSPGTFADMFAARRCDPRAFQRVYPDRRHLFLKAHFRNSVEVAAFFSVDEKTARLWMEGCGGPRGWAVSYAVMSIPTAASYLLEAA